MHDHEMRCEQFSLVRCARDERDFSRYSRTKRQAVSYIVVFEPSPKIRQEVPCAPPVGRGIALS